MVLCGKNGSRLQRGSHKGCTPARAWDDVNVEGCQQMKKQIQKRQYLASSLACMLLLVGTGQARADNDASRGDNESVIQRGYAIAPVPLYLMGKNRALVGLGSYIVNSGGCNDCHTNPTYSPGGNPFLGQPEQI